MKRSRRLKPVVQMVQKNAEEALLKLGEANSLWQRDKRQLDELILYRDEYLARFRRDDPLVMHAQKALELRNFLVQLDRAIEAQESQVKSSLLMVQQHQQNWLAARSKEQAMQTLTDRYREQEDKHAAKKEQAELDDHTLSMWHRRPH